MVKALEARSSRVCDRRFESCLWQSFVLRVVDLNQTKRKNASWDTQLYGTRANHKQPSFIGLDRFLEYNTYSNAPLAATSVIVLIHFVFIISTALVHLNVSTIAITNCD